MGAEGFSRRRIEARDRVLPPNPLNPVLTVILPCRNEAESVARYATDLFPALDSIGVPYEVVIVDDGSTDGTASAARAFLMTRKNIRIVMLASNRGMGAAIRAGFDAASGEWIATLDADLTFPPAALKDLLAAGIAAKADLVSGSPFLKSGDLDDVSWARRLPSLMINALYRGLFGLRLSAYTPVLRLYRFSFIKNLTIASTGFEINAEIAARASGPPRLDLPPPRREMTAHP